MTRLLRGPISGDDGPSDAKEGKDLASLSIKALPSGTSDDMSPSVQSSATRFHSVRAMVVDDEASSRRISERYLTALGLPSTSVIVLTDGQFTVICGPPVVFRLV